MTSPTPPLAPVPSSAGRDAAADMRQAISSPFLDFDSHRAQRLEATEDPSVRFRLHGRVWRLPIGTEIDVEVMDRMTSLQGEDRLSEVMRVLLGEEQYGELRKAAQEVGAAVALSAGEAEKIVDAWGRASGVGGVGESSASPTS